MPEEVAEVLADEVTEVPPEMPPAVVPAPGWPVAPAPSSDPSASVPPMARTVPPLAPMRSSFLSPHLHRVVLLCRGVYELGRHLARRGRDLWRSDERVLDVRARVRERPLAFLMGAATLFTLLVMIASASSARLDADATPALGAVSRDAAALAKLNAALAALPRCR